MTTLSESIVGGKNYPEQEKDKEELMESLLELIDDECHCYMDEWNFKIRINEILKDYTVKKVKP